MNKVLQSWFRQIRDYRTGFNTHYPKPANLVNLTSGDCLCGHWELEGYHLHQRYPQAIQSPEYRVFTFIRDPLSTRLSLYRFETKHKVNSVLDARKHVLARPNWMSNRFPITEANYIERLSGYYFIGILERGQDSLDLLANLISKPRMILPRENATIAGEESILDQETIEEFRELNWLDYKIYDYCVEMLNRNIMRAR